MVTIILIVLLILLLTGGIGGWRYRDQYGTWPSGIVGILLLVVLIFLVMRLL